MNERIKELMAQAGFDPAAIERMGVMPQAEKFAELIVRECATRIESHAQELRSLCRNDVSWANKEIYEGQADTCDDLVWQIGKIFESK